MPESPEPEWTERDMSAEERAWIVVAATALYKAQNAAGASALATDDLALLHRYQAVHRALSDVLGAAVPTPTEQVSALSSEKSSPLSDSFWDHAETAAYLGIPVATLHQMNYKGTGPRSYKIGRHRKYRPDDVDQWCEFRASRPTS